MKFIFTYGKIPLRAVNNGGRKGFFIMATMGTTYTLVLSLFAIGGTMGIYYATDSYLYAALFLLFFFSMGRALYPVLDNLWYKLMAKFFPLPPVTPFSEKRFVNEGTAQEINASYASGMRILCITEALEYNAQTKSFYNHMASEALKYLSENSPTFAIRRKTVEKRRLPIQYCWSLCGQDGVNIKKCLKGWINSPALKLIKTHAMNKDLFIYDDKAEFNGELTYYTVMVHFDGTLPTADQVAMNAKKAGQNGKEAVKEAMAEKTEELVTESGERIESELVSLEEGSAEYVAAAKAAEEEKAAKKAAKAAEAAKEAEVEPQNEANVSENTEA